MKQKVYSKDIILILAASFCYMSSTMLVTPLITGFAGSLGASAALMGMIGGLMNLCSLVCRPFAGNLADRLSKYKVSFVGAGLILIGCAGYVLAGNEAMVIAARLINGVGFACCSVCMSTWMSNLLPREKIGSGMGLYGTMNALGMAIAPAIGVSVYQSLGYRAAFLIAAAFGVLTVLIIQFVGDKGEPATAPAASGRERLQLIEPKVIPVALVIMLFAIPYCATQSFLVSYVEARGVNVSVSLFFPLYAAVLLVLRLSLRQWFDRLPFGVFLCAGAVSAAVSILLLAGLRTNLHMVLAAAFMAGGYGIMCSVCQSSAILLAGPGKRGLANSTYYVGLDLGMTLGPILGGELFAQADTRLFYPALLVTVPLVLAVYAATLLYARRACRRM